jgi:hypothetical protein
MNIKKGLTIDEIKEAIEAMPEAPKLGDLRFVELHSLPKNSVLVSPNLMALLKAIFKQA